MFFVLGLCYNKKMEKMKKISRFLKSNTRYFLALSALLFSLAVNKGFFTVGTVTQEDCAGGKCVLKPEKMPSLSDSSPFFYLDESEGIKKGDYYRVYFKAAALQDSEILLKLTRSSFSDNEVKQIEIKKNDQTGFYEAVFFADDDYQGVMLEKVRYDDGAEIFVGSNGISKLRVKNEIEFQKIKPTIFGEIRTDIADQQQIDESGFRFSQLKQSGMAVGQTFLAKADYISGITLKIDITKEEDPGSRQFEMKIYKAELQGETLKLPKENEATLEFSLKSIEKYRQDDGTFLFPVNLKVEKGRHYFFAINNLKIENSEFNNLSFRGSSSNDSYPDGSAVVILKKIPYQIDGDLFFAIHGAGFKEINGRWILPQAIIEDLGGSAGRYSYQNEGSLADLLALSKKTSDVEFNDDKKTISGMFDNDESFWEYEVAMVYPFKNLRLSAEQVDESWNRAEISYSFDQKEWKKISSADEEGMQKYDYSIPGNGKSNLIYLKISPDKSRENESRFYGLKNFKLIGELYER